MQTFFSWKDVSSTGGKRRGVGLLRVSELSHQMQPPNKLICHRVRGKALTDVKTPYGTESRDRLPWAAPTSYPWSIFSTAGMGLRLSRGLGAQIIKERR